MGNRPFSRKNCNFFCKLTVFWGGDELPAAGTPSQALPRQLPQRGSQAVKFIAKVLGAMRKLPAVLLALPLRKDFPRSGGRCRVATKGGICQARQGLTERAHAVTFVTQVLGSMSEFPAVLLPLPLRKDFPRSGGRCRAATKGGVWHRVAMTERAHAVSLGAKVSSAIRSFPAMPKAPSQRELSKPTGFD